MFSLLRFFLPFAHAQDYTTELDNAGTAVYGSSDAAAAQADLPALIGTIVGGLLGLLGIYLLYLFLRAGYLWMTAQGNSKKVDEAKDTMINAVIGLIIVVAAYSIVNFVIDSLGSLVT